LLEELQLNLQTVIPFRGVCQPGNIGPDLSRYPNLAHVPDRGTITHLAGVTVEDIVKKATSDDWMDVLDSESTVAVLDNTAAICGVSFDELLDALRYARANKLI
jgi:hypothetical protein